MQNILLVEDSIDAIEMIQRGLIGLANLTLAKTIAEAKLLVNAISFDLILLDISLPDGNGLDLCAELQASEFLSSIPVIMVTSSQTIEDRVRAFTMGVEDYLIKPFNLVELRVRIESRLIKLLKMRMDSLIKIGGIAIDKNMQRVYVGTETIELTSSEFKILMLLVSNAGDTLDRETISDKVWGENAETSIRQVDAKVSRLRRKIGADKIESVHGVGYRFVA